MSEKAAITTDKESYASVKGIIIGHTWFGNKAFYPVQRGMRLDELSVSVEELEAFDNFGFRDIIGGILLVYPYKTIDDVLYLAQQYTNTVFVGEVTEQDEDNFICNSELWL